MKVNLAKYNNASFNPGGFFIARALWYAVNFLIFKSSVFPFSKLKVLLLRCFGGKVGNMVIIKPNVNIKYAWNLHIANNCWIGENVWIDNLALVSIEQNVCISQGAMLLTGNHNYLKESFDLLVAGITLQEGVWIGANSVVCPGITAMSHSVLTVSSVATKNLDAYAVYQGNPAIKIRERTIK